MPIFENEKKETDCFYGKVTCTLLGVFDRPLEHNFNCKMRTLFLLHRCRSLIRVILLKHLCSWISFTLKLLSQGHLMTAVSEKKLLFFIVSSNMIWLSQQGTTEFIWSQTSVLPGMPISVSKMDLISLMIYADICCRWKQLFNWCTTCKILRSKLIKGI